MDYSSFNYVGSISVADSSRAQIGNNTTFNNTTNNYFQDREEKHPEALCSTDPRHDKSRIEQTNGGLLKESYQWILHNPEFQRWCDPKENCPLLWIRGDPGKGKTMLLSGIINELEPFTRLGASGTGTSLSYFFCQATNSGLNNYAAVLRGLAYLLVEQQPCLLSHVRGKASLSPGHWNSGVAIGDILSEMLRDPALQNVIFVVDALDECITLTDLEFLLNFITSTASTQVRWLVSSRNIYDIEKHLRQAQTTVALSLELNEDSVSQAVNSYVQHRVGQLRNMRQFSSKQLMDAETYLTQNAHGTFLWVSLVCQRLSRSKRWEVGKFLRHFPPGLKELYDRMMETISHSSSEDLYRRILAIISTVHRPITFSELMAIEDLDLLAQSSGDSTTTNNTSEDRSVDEGMVQEMVMECGCFLTFRNKTIYFVHQSAKDFLTNTANILIPSDLAQRHLALFDKSLKCLAKLKMDIYDNIYPATSGCNFRPKFPEHDPLSGLAYFCQFWAHHLRDSQTICDQDQSHYNKVHQFMTDKFLFWLEALSLLKSLPAAMETLQILKGLSLCDETMALVEDARLFFLCFRTVITAHPLQIYASGLLFSPKGSLIRRHFEDCSPKFVIKKPQVDAQWPPYLSIPGWHDRMTFSPDNKSLVTAFYGELVRWQVSDGMASRRFKLGGLGLKTPSPDLNWFACVTINGDEEQTAIQVRDLESNSVKWSRPLHNRQAKRMKFSPDGRWLAVCFDKEFALWGFEENEFRSGPLEISPSDLRGIEFSSDSTLMAIFGFSRMGSEGILVFDVRTGERYKNRNPEIETVRSAVFSPNTHEIMMCCNGNVWSWDITGGKCDEWLQFDGYAQHVATSHDSSWIAVTSGSTIFLYEKQSQKLLQQCEMPPDGYLSSVAVSFDNKRLAACFKNSVCLWDISSSISTQAHCGRISVKKVFVSDNGNLMALALETKIQVLDATTGSHLFESDMPWCWDSRSAYNLASFSSKGHLLVASSSSSSSSSLLRVWNLVDQTLLHEIKVADSISQLAVSLDGSNHGQWVAAITTEKVQVWDSTTMTPSLSLEHDSGNDLLALHFSDGKLGVSWSSKDDYDVYLTSYDATNGTKLTTSQFPGLEHPGTGLSVSPSGQSTAWINEYESLMTFISQEEGSIRKASVLIDTLHGPYVSFIDDSTALTGQGSLYIDAVLAKDAIESCTPQERAGDIPTFYPDFEGYGCSADGEWITLDGCPFLWLPMQYRRKDWDTRLATGERSLVMHSFSGVYFIEFSEDAGEFVCLV